jgi:hypothetical protein
MVPGSSVIGTIGRIFQSAVERGKTVFSRYKEDYRGVSRYMPMRSQVLLYLAIYPFPQGLSLFVSAWSLLRHQIRRNRSHRSASTRDSLPLIGSSYTYFGVFRQSPGLRPRYKLMVKR